MIFLHAYIIYAHYVARFIVSSFVESAPNVTPEKSQGGCKAWLARNEIEILFFFSNVKNNAIYYGKKKVRIFEVGPFFEVQHKT